MANKLTSAVKKVFCTRDLDTGDVVRVPDAKWDSFDHPIGGPGRWAIFVFKRAKKFVVRPTNSDGVTGKPVEVDHVEHLDDVIQEAAIKMYYETRGKKR